MTAEPITGPMTRADRAELEASRALTDLLLDVFASAGDGDSEARAGDLPGLAGFPHLEQLRQAANRVLDLNDAFVREASAALRAAGEGRYHRHVLERGFPGSLRVGARLLNEGQAQMRRSADLIAEQQAERVQLADQFESVVVGLSEQVEQAARRLSQTMGQLTASAQSAGAEVTQARGTIDALSEAGAQIRDVVQLIDSIASQTRLLALNATIEAARVGEAGKGFAVVANEVKELSNETQQATQRVGDQVELIGSSTGQAVEAMSNTGSTVDRMNELVDDMAGAVEGDAEHEGLMRATASLRSEISSFLQVMRR